MIAFEKNVKDLETKFGSLQSMPPSAQARELRQIKQNHDRIKREFAALEPGIKPSEQPQFEELQNRINRLQVEINMQQGSAQQSSLFGAAENREPVPQDDNRELYELNTQQVIERGDKTQAETIQIIQRARTQVEQTKEVAAATEQELHRQGEVLNKVEDMMEDIDSELKRSTRILGQMLRRYATDKIILCLIVVIGIIILVLIIYGAAGLDEDNNFNTPDDDT